MGIGFWALGGLEWAPTPSRKRAKNELVQFGCIGVGGKGHSDSDDANRLGKVVAICDIDDNILNAAAARFPDAKKFHDFRAMLAEMGDAIDAVTVSTPDHTHAIAAMRAMDHGKHCFCQKPLTHSIEEARRMGELARANGVATQMGNQGTASSELRKAAAILKSGALGTVKEVHVWSNRPVWAQGIERPASKPVPQHVKWDLWLGPAPKREYADGYHTFGWRGWWDFGTGALGDMACHTMNMPFMGLDLRDPKAVEAESSGHNRDSYPAWSRIKYEFPARGGREALTVFWYDGGQKVSAELLGEEPAGSGILVIGEAGKMYSPGDNGGEYRLIGDVPIPSGELEQSPGHFEEFIRAIETGQPAASNFPDYAGPLTETVLLGNLALWTGGRVEWDPYKLMATNGGSDVERLIRKEYPEGWGLEG
jgi:predicted dehydrogenase